MKYRVRCTRLNTHRLACCRCSQRVTGGISGALRAPSIAIPRRRRCLCTMVCRAVPVLLSVVSSWHALGPAPRTMRSPRAPAGPVAPAAFSHPNVDRITLLSIRPPPSGYLRSCCGTLRGTSPSHSPSRTQLPPVRLADHLHAGAQDVALTHLHGLALSDRVRPVARVRDAA